MRTMRLWAFLIVIVTLLLPAVVMVDAFISPSPSSASARRRAVCWKNLMELQSNKDSGYSDDDAAAATTVDQDALYLERFRRRRQKVMMQQAQADENNNSADGRDGAVLGLIPPHPALRPQEVVRHLLEGLRQPAYYYSDAHRHHYNPNHRLWGLQVLLQSSTDSWRRVLYRQASVSVGRQQRLNNDPTTSSSFSLLPDEQQQQQDTATTVIAAAAALETVMSRHQYAILLGLEDADYVMDFCTEPADYGDGTCWLECRLRNAETDELLVVLGWSLVRQQQQPSRLMRGIDEENDDASLSTITSSSDEENNNNNSSSSHQEAAACWLVDGLDWQDFREPYRPGIGREEWERICG